MNIELSGLIGVITSLIVEGLKRIPRIPLVAGQTAKIRKAAAVLSFLGTLGTAIATDDISLMNVVAGTIIAFLVSHLTFKAVLNNPNKPAVVQ